MITGGNAARRLHRTPSPASTATSPSRASACRSTKLFERDRRHAELSRRRCCKNITVDGEIMKVPIARPHRRHGLLQQGRRREGRRRPDHVEVARRHLRRLRQGEGGRLHPDRAWAATSSRQAYLFHALVAAVAGPRHLQQLLRRDARRDGVRRARDAQGARRASARSQQHADAGSPNRQWNETTNLVITGKALMQIHGDWMKGEWQGRRQGRSARISAASTFPAPRRWW